MRVWVPTAILAGLLAGAGACGGKVQARTPEPSPGLEIPAPPTRVVVPVTLPEPAPPTPPSAPPTQPRSRETPPPTSRTPDRTAPPTPAIVPPADLAPVLQTTANPGELEQRARTSLAAAQRDLDHVDYRALGANARDQYDSAKRFIRQADSAIKGKNFTYAAQLADKAAALANLLVK